MLLFASAIQSVHAMEHSEQRQNAVAHLRREVDELLATPPSEISAKLGLVGHALEKLSDLPELGTREDLPQQALRLAAMAFNCCTQNMSSQADEDVDHVAAALLRLSRTSALMPPVRMELELISNLIARANIGSASLVTKFNDPGLRLRMLGLLADTRAILRSRAHAGISGFRISSKKFDELVSLISQELPTVLCAWANEASGTANRLNGLRRVAGVRAWLRLWLALDVARIYHEKQAPGTLNAEKNEVAEALCATLSECIRGQLYRSSPGFIRERDAGSRAYQVLVIKHARRRCSVPAEFDLRSHLRGIISVGRVRPTDAEGHVEHVLELYTLGSFIGDLLIGPRDGESLSRAFLHIAGRTGLGVSPKNMAELRAAFALAALFHDSGTMVFPAPLAFEGAVIDSEKSVSDALSRIRETAAGAGRSLMDRCIDELRTHGCLGSSLLDACLPWFERQRKAGRPDHALVGAWYLLRCWLQQSLDVTDVLKSAVRAVLLHGALGVQIDSRQDPVAALLVVCDEIFDWNPSRSYRVERDETGQDLNDRHGRKISDYEGRGIAMDVEGMWFVVRADTLVVGIDYERNGNKAWPAVSLLLRPPEMLDVAVLEIWLRTAQNVGRILPGPEWRPTLYISSQVPPRLRSAGLTTKQLLEEIYQHSVPLSGRLQMWLESGAVVEEMLGDTVSVESVRLGYISSSFASDDVTHFLPELLQAARKFVEQREAVLHRR